MWTYSYDALPNDIMLNWQYLKYFQKTFNKLFYKSIFKTFPIIVIIN